MQKFKTCKISQKHNMEKQRTLIVYINETYNT